LNIERTHDAALVNAIMSEAFGRRMDASRKVEKPTTFALVGEHGVIMCVLSKPQRPGLYSVTVAVKEGGRGKWGSEFISAAVSWMFKNTDAVRLWAAVAADNRKSAIAASASTGKMLTVERINRSSLLSITRERWSTSHALPA
jgi:hypothetical protein